MTVGASAVMAQIGAPASPDIMLAGVLRCWNAPRDAPSGVELLGTLARRL